MAPGTPPRMDIILHHRSLADFKCNFEGWGSGGVMCACGDGAMSAIELGGRPWVMQDFVHQP